MEKKQALAALGSLGQENRLDIFRLLVEAGGGGIAAGEIGEQLGLPAPTLSFHLAHLRHAGLVTQTRNGRSLVYAADFALMNALLSYLTENCCRAGAVCAPVAARRRTGSKRRTRSANHETHARARL